MYMYVASVRKTAMEKHFQFGFCVISHKTPQFREQIKLLKTYLISGGCQIQSEKNFILLFVEKNMIIATVAIFSKLEKASERNPTKP